MEELVRHGADIIVVACNTATAAAIATLRAEFSNPSDSIREWSGGRISHIRFIGMEPAVKPAALGTSSGVIGVLATAGTLKGSKYLTTKGLYEDNIRIAEHVGEGFVELVESGKLEGEEAEAVVSRSLLPLLEEGADTIVLGCTHYPFLEAAIRKVADKFTSASGLKAIHIINPAPAVARQTLKVMDEEGIAHSGSKDGGPEAAAHNVILLSSGPSDALEATFRLI